MAAVSSTKEGRETVNDFLKFLNVSCTAFHACDEVGRRLGTKGFVKLNERDDWKKILKPGGKYFFTRNGSTIVAFAVGKKYKPGNGVVMIGAHTDSPCLKLKPVSKVTKSGYNQIGVQCYGGGLWTTWFDRDLTVAGRVLVKRDGVPSHELVRVPKSLCRIPSLAIHLNRGSGTEFKINKENHLNAVLESVSYPLRAKAPHAEMEKSNKSDTEDKFAPPTEFGAPPRAQHHWGLLDLIAKELKCKIEDIIDIELQLIDTQDSCLGGACDEFIYSGRLDNLASVYVVTSLHFFTLLLTHSPHTHRYMTTQAMMDTCDDLDSEKSIRAFACFDHEEVGSRSAQGAGGPIIMDTMRRLASCFGGDEEGAVERMLQSSFLISSDMAHGIHPNYAAKHQTQHAPMMHQGIVIKHNVNQRYATNMLSCVLFRQMAGYAKAPIQEFVVRNDSACGSTIGPIVAGNTGMRTVDVGGAQWSMHSIREIMGTDDVIYGVRTFRSAFKNFSALSGKLFFCGTCNSGSGAFTLRGFGSGGLKKF